MGTSLAKMKYNLVCVAHPDDETLFFGGLLLSGRKTIGPKPGPEALSSRPLHESRSVPWVIVCATSDGNADRRRQFTDACKALGVTETHWWGFPDKYEERLPIDRVVEKLQALPPPNEVFTHGIVGEYGHPHHQDVSYAVHKAFPGHTNLYSVAYNTFPELEVKLTADDFALKARILTQIYGSETNRFLNVLPATFVEGFRRLDTSEVEAIYDYFAGGKSLAKEKLKAHQWLIDYLPHLKGLSRPF